MVYQLVFPPWNPTEIPNIFQKVTNEMVEVAGIEPASENLSRQASTCVVRVLLNP